MERTPSPPRRLHTPPAPLHGPQYDSYEPFSPRRSSRVAAQQHLHHEQSSPTRRRTTRDVTPSSSRKKPATRTSNLTLSPPSSPISPAKHHSPRSSRRSHLDNGAIDSDSDHVAPTPARRYLTTMAPHGMLPTPAKTPRKRALQSEETLGSTARILFPNRPATIEEAMPSPRKGRKSRKDAYTLESFAERMEEANEHIEVFTDSKERIPTRDADEDNPFVTKKGKGKAKAAPPKPRKVDAKTARMNEAVERDEGMVYLFRGKKVFRKFHNTPRSNASEEEPEFSGDELRHKAGAVAHRPLTRAQIKPRLLFQEEIQQRERENGHDDDEEAITDIEVPIATPSRKTRKTAESGVSVTQEATPPPTTRVKRQISFDSWSRVKPARSSGSTRDSKKRSGPPLESTADKRARSERSEPSSAMSIDDF
ncbi:hypothetical protein BU26DRAFT_509342 [Trematosphaeria pertusa]|uniref:Uncharacterized protein n=1 Tax=Trematosphaeria pertusa TaxID=390896 RepID=A0A6A6I370_9PLEO|nr:uncharacterized protein BU26DRAFT_509342 [Trematosphaeria pertusa]KAF2244448.1 hypothetical protein BU26DRAFT_509342 [Trematosphaeria pertusa]